MLYNDNYHLNILKPIYQTYDNSEDERITCFLCELNGKEQILKFTQEEDADGVIYYTENLNLWNMFDNNRMYYIYETLNAYADAFGYLQEIYKIDTLYNLEAYWKDIYLAIAEKENCKNIILSAIQKREEEIQRY